ncbi:DNA polymerase zeta catalytic subunit-like protein [Tanacetum coccineum]
MKADGTVDKYKARVVIQGFRQREGLDYFDTYSPVTRITSIRMIIDIAALKNLEIHQMDVKTAFLNGDLEEEISMNQPEGFIAPGQEGKLRTPISTSMGIPFNKKIILIELGVAPIKSIQGYIEHVNVLDDRHPAVIEGYSDANWISDIKRILDRRAKSTMYNGKSRHILRRHNSIRQLLSTGVISIDYVKSKDNIVDLHTKGLGRELVSKTSKVMSLKPLKE